ncbi:hypothetical protein O0I10_006552 [Lichtheimia ornata]|uniref:Uncharacterized protein n=1 Tax=Lichtheimia ornata TaxID=688661 RepID=A0AAD7V417_9FUNG|nr:uncharacterized protein O0I10_006552 [Lichtheimia ornata]KAJ8657737.1 hypothetical protein O0I10_006552 [Lichtheimia ornata]
MGGTTKSSFFFTPTSQSKWTASIGWRGGHGDTFQLQTFNNKYTRDRPMTQAPIAIQHFAVLAFIQCLKGASFDMLDDDTSGTSKILTPNKNALRWLNGKHGIGSATQDLLIDELVMEEEQQHNRDGMEIRVFICGKDAIEKYHKALARLYILHYQQHIKEVIVLYYLGAMAILSLRKSVPLMLPLQFEHASSGRPTDYQM